MQELVQSYSSMTKRSMLDKQAVDGLSGALHSCSKLSDTSGKLTQVSQALRLPWPRKEEVVSQPVSAWKNGRHLDFLLPMACATK